MTRSRGFAVGLILYALAAVAIVAALAALAYRVNHWCNAACVAQTGRADAAEAAIKIARDRATAMALLWDGERIRRETDARQRETERTARFQPVETAARNLPATVARVSFPGIAAGVLDDAIRAGNAALAGTAAQPPEKAGAAAAAAAVDVGGVTAWGVACARQYADVVDQVLGWQSFYASLQAAQIQEGIH